MTTLLLRAIVSLGLLLGLAWWLDVGDLLSRLAQLRSAWVALALALSVLQVAVSAWRWRFTASRLGIDLPFRDAVREYYLATFLNQVLPGGVAGDLSRAWRHARGQRQIEASAGSAIRAVILERASGQAVMTVVAVVSFLSLPMVRGTLRWVIAAGVVITCVSAATATFIWRRRLDMAQSLPGRIWRDTRAALLSGQALPIQLTSSALVVGSYLAVYLVAARAVGVDTPPLILLPLVAPVLLTLLIPVTIAGWGLRESAAALLWGVAGLTAVDGVAVSVAYGLLVFASSLPGALVLLRTLRRRRPSSAKRRGV